MTLTLDMIQSMALAVVILMAGQAIRKRVSFLERFCIPAPVIGGDYLCTLHPCYETNGCP